MKHIQIIFISIMFLTWLLPATAKTYRWVNENGVTIYSQSPPPSGNAAIIKPPPKPAASPDEIMKNLQQRQEAMDKVRNKETEADKIADREAKNTEMKKKNCEVSRKNLEVSTRHPRVRMKQEDGSFKHLTDKERQAQIDKANKDIEKFCN
ncbi:MAG: DUF4124 domain-containing protein [Gammaproteobacteria bacterium]|nr:DUF4124 domain-containing protein [Gammaproteobacteria bacterium]